MNSGNIQKELEAVTNKYPNAFSEKLGTMKGVQVKTNVIPNSKPKYMKDQTVPFTIKAAVQLKIERIEDEAILKLCRFPSGPVQSPLFLKAMANTIFVRTINDR